MQFHALKNSMQGEEINVDEDVAAEEGVDESNAGQSFVDDAEEDQAAKAKEAVKQLVSKFSWEILQKVIPQALQKPSNLANGGEAGGGDTDGVGGVDEQQDGGLE